MLRPPNDCDKSTSVSWPYRFCRIGLFPSAADPDPRAVTVRNPCLCSILFAFLVVVLGPAQLVAGEGQEWGDMFSPTIRSFNLGASARAENEPEVDAGNGTHYERTTLRATARTQLWRGEKDELVLSGSALEALIDSGAVLPGGKTVPDRLYDLRGDVSWRHPVRDGQVLGVSVGTVSATDRPFHDSGVIGFSAMASALLPASERSSWMLLLSYSNDRARYNNIPLPGFAWMWRDRPLMPTFIATVGFPFAVVAWNPDPRFGMDAAVTGFGDIRAAISGMPLTGMKWLRLRAAYDWTSETYRRDERLEDEDRIFFRARRITLGVTLGPPANAIELYGGRLFQRQVFEGYSVNDNGQRLTLDDGWLVGAGARVLF
jgi:hypothetical protein